MHRLTIAFALLAVLGCTSGGNRSKTAASIDDGLTSQGFRIATVDGNPPTRERMPSTDVVPYILVEPRSHTFTMEGNPKPFMAEVEEGKQYRTELRDGMPTLLLARQTSPER